MLKLQPPCLTANSHFFGSLKFVISSTRIKVTHRLHMVLYHRSPWHLAWHFQHQVSNFIAFTQLTLLCPCRVSTPARPAPCSYSRHIAAPLPAACALSSPPHNHMCHITAPLLAARTSSSPHSQPHVPRHCTSPSCAHHVVHITLLPLRGH